MSGHGCLLTLVRCRSLLMTLSVMILGNGWAVAQESRQVSAVAGFAEHEALGGVLKQQVRDAVSRRLEQRTGHEVLWSVMPDTWRSTVPGGGGQSLTPAMCRQGKLDLGIQGLSLWIDYAKGTYLIRCAVFHREFNDVIMSRVVSVVDRRLVVNTVDRLVQRVWRPVGEITGGEGGSLLVLLAGSGVRLPVPGSPLEVVAVLERRDGRHVQPWKGKFLVVREHRDASTMTTSVVDAGQQVPAFFRHVGTPRARYFVRGVKPRRGPTRIRVISDMDGRPREACAVFVSDRKPGGGYPGGPPSGLTDEGGYFSVPFPGIGFRYVTVACGFFSATKAVASGQGAFPIVFKMPRVSAIKEKEASFQEIRRRVKETEDWINVTTEGVNRQVVSADEAGIEKAIVTLQRSPDWQKFRHDLKELQKDLEKDAASEGGRAGTDKLVAVVQEELNRVSRDKRNWQANIDRTEANLRTIKATRLVAEFKAAREAFKWTAAASALEEYCRITPDDEDAKKLLSRLQRALPEHSPRHAMARRQARDGVRAESAADVLSSWRATVKEIRVLIREDDGPVLWELLEELATSIKLVADESGVVARRVDSAGDDLSDEEQQRLENRLKAIKDALSGLAAVQKDTKTLVKDFFNQ